MSRTALLRMLYEHVITKLMQLFQAGFLVTQDKTSLEPPSDPSSSALSLHQILVFTAARALLTCRVIAKELNDATREMLLAESSH